MTVTVGLGVAFAVADDAEVGRWVGAGVPVARTVDDALVVADPLAVDDALSVAEALSLDVGEAVRDAPSEALPVVTCGLGV